MNRIVTILLVLFVAAVAVFLFVFEPHFTSTRERQANKDFVLNLNPAAIDSIRIVSGDEGFEIARGEAGWEVGPKPKDAASPQLVMELLQAASSLRVFDLIGAEGMNGRSLKDFGLAKPKSQIELRGGGATATLYFGREAVGAGRVYVRRADADDIYIVSDDLQTKAFRRPQDFRDRRLSNLTPDRIDKFTIKHAGGELALERGGHGWEIVRPLRARADQEAVQKLLAGALGTQIDRFVADDANDLGSYGLGEPRAELILAVDGEARPVALRIGADEDDKTVLAQFTARDSIYRLPAEALAALQVAPDALRDRRTAALNLDTIDAIRFDSGGKEKLFERDGEGWKSDGAVLTEAEVARRAHMLTDAKVIEYLPLTDENLRRTGLDQPSGSISFDAWLSENTPETTAGRRPVLVLTLGKQEADKAYIRVNDDPEICVIPTVKTDIFR